MRYHWLLLSYLGILLWAAPADAGTLLSWRFDQGQNRLTFTTDKRVQPKAKLIQNPTRLVIDLPQTTIQKPILNQSLSGAIKSIRVGQPEPTVARIVIEFAPGYTVDPQKLIIKGASPTTWTVNLPTPARSTVVADSLPPLEAIPSTRMPLSTTRSPLLNPQRATTPPSNNPEFPRRATALSQSRYIQVTKNGLFINLDSKDGDKITLVRNAEQGTIDVDLMGVSIPEELKSRRVAVNSYGVESIEFNQVSGNPNQARLTLQVSPDSSDWDGAISKLGGIVLWPKGGVSSSAATNTPLPSRSANTEQQNNNQKALINSVSLSEDRQQLLITSEENFNPSGTWNRDIGVYEIKIPNATLAQDFANPDLGNNSPISRLRIRQDDSGNVLILIQPALGVTFEGLKPADDNAFLLQMRDSGAFNRALVAPPAPPLELPSTETTKIPQQRNSTTSSLDRAWQRISPTPGNRQRNRKLVVVLDPGHGGKDPGAIGRGGLREKDVILPISNDVAEILEKQGIQVIMTRDSDYFVTLDGRTRMANRADADLFVSIHANSMGLGRPDINGLETYYFDSGRELAQTIHRNILRRLDIPDRRVRRARFYVLRKSLMPSVLVEVGFVTGDQDSAKLANPKYRQRMAEAIATGILEYIQNNKL